MCVVLHIFPVLVRKWRFIWMIKWILEGQIHSVVRWVWASSGHFCAPCMAPGHLASPLEPGPPQPCPTCRGSELKAEEKLLGPKVVHFVLRWPGWPAGSVGTLSPVSGGRSTVYLNRAGGCCMHSLTASRAGIFPEGPKVWQEFPADGLMGLAFCSHDTNQNVILDTFLEESRRHFSNFPPVGISEDLT